MVADALIYHPTVDRYLRYVATTGTLLPVPLQLTQLIPSRSRS